MEYESIDEELENYKKFRGKCKQLSELEIEKDSTLRLVRGHYICPIWGKEAHWWCVRPDGTIVDPSVKQYPTKGVGAEYIEFDGMCECSNCEKKVKEEEAYIDGRYAFCSIKCHKSYIGL